ncbi:glucoamylase [Candidatus Woesearchaeota archaeon]|nr:glucoamylase [Candidatus Woesearchaeota archaeon]
MEKLYIKSIEVLKSVQLENGGCLASPKGTRYPHIYTRDHAFCTMGFVSAGLFENAKKALEFVWDRQLEDGTFPQRYDVDGKDSSYKPLQVGEIGLMTVALYEYVNATNDLEFVKKYWKKLEKGMDYIKKDISKNRGLVYSPNSIHEFPPYESGWEIWANALSCGALRRAYELGKRINKKNNYDEPAKSMRNGINNYMWNSRVKSFVKTIRLKESSSVATDADASTIGLSEFGVIDDNDDKMILTVKRLEKELWHPDLGGICRYQRHIGRNNGGWGPWPHFTLMVAKHFIRRGIREEADMYLNWVLSNTYDFLIPEHIASKDEFEDYVQDFTEAGILREDRLVMIENVKKHPKFVKESLAFVTIPLAWPHAELIRTWNLYKSKFY